jgi:uncharacterized protein YecT (DUF1311 family)
VSENRCHLCHRDLHAESLIRCREAECPMKATRRHASVVVLMGLVGIAVIIAALFGTVRWLTKGSGQPTEAVADGAGVIAPLSSPTGAPRRDATAAKPWAFKVAPAPTTGASSEPSPAGGQQLDLSASEEAADPQAGTFVQSFSCSGKLSASRSWICTHRSLATQDYNLSLQYRSALAQSQNRSLLRKDHAAWLAKLDTLGANHSAIAQSYQQWRDELSKH